MNPPVFLVVVEIRTEYQRFPARSSPNEIISAPVEDTRRVGLFAVRKRQVSEKSLKSALGAESGYLLPTKQFLLGITVSRTMLLF